MGSKTKLPVSGLYSVSRKTYDNQGRPSQVFEPKIGSVSGYVSTVSYDALGRVIPHQAPTTATAGLMS